MRCARAVTTRCMQWQRCESANNNQLERSRNAMELYRNPKVVVRTQTKRHKIALKTLLERRDIAIFRKKLIISMRSRGALGKLTCRAVAVATRQGVTEV